MSANNLNCQCSLPCPWKGTGMCVVTYLSREFIDAGRVSLGIMHGIRSLYQLEEPPACITREDSLDLHDESDARVHAPPAPELLAA